MVEPVVVPKPDPEVYFDVAEYFVTKDKKKLSKKKKRKRSMKIEKRWPIGLVVKQ